jgi:hypothetical protein
MLGQFILYAIIFVGLFLALHYGGKRIVRWEIKHRAGQR